MEEKHLFEIAKILDQEYIGSEKTFSAKREGGCWNLTTNKCKPGYTHIPGMSSSSFILREGCYPDSVARKMLNTFWKSVCLDTGFFIISETLSYGDSHTWDDSLGCISTKTWKMRKDSKWIEITKTQYDSLSAIKQ